MAPRRIQTTLLTSATPAPQFAVKHDLTDVLAAKYGGIQVPLEQQQDPSVHPPESAFQPHQVYVSPYQDADIQELTTKIDKNKIKQGKRWNKMIKKIQKRAHREKYMIPMSTSTQRRRQKKADSIYKPEVARTMPRSKLNIKLPGIAKKLAKLTEKVKKPRKSKRCEVLGKVPTKIAGYTYKHKKTGKDVTVKSYTRKVLKCLD